MDVAAQTMIDPQRSRHGDELFHRVVRRLNDPRAEEQPFDIVAAIELERQFDDFADALTAPAARRSRPG